MPILDVPKTLEYLDTTGVTVFSFKRDFFPEFFTREDNIEALQMTNLEILAQTMLIKFQKLRLRCGVRTTQYFWALDVLCC